MPPQSDDVSASMVIGHHITVMFSMIGPLWDARECRERTCVDVCGRVCACAGVCRAESCALVWDVVRVARKIERFNPARFEPRL